MAEEARMTTIIVERDVPARMRDGVLLYADVYRPGEPGRYPVLLCRTPYGREVSPLLVAILNPLMALHEGYVVIIQDTRGRGASEGQFAYLAQLPQEGPDGYDTVEWAAALPYASGAVGMFGMSYSAWAQWAAAQQCPPHLRAIAPLQTPPASTQGLVYRGGAFELGYTLFWHLMMSKEVTMRALAAEGASEEETALAGYEIVAAFDRLSAGGYNELPLRDLPSLRPLGLAGLLRYLLDPGPERLAAWAKVEGARVEIPVLNIGGWHDCFIQRTLDDYVAMGAAGDTRRGRLLVGPWAHGNLGAWLTATIGEMEYGMAAHGESIELAEDLTSIQLRWFDHWLKNIDNGVQNEPPVRVFVTGENLWMEWEQWPPGGVRELTLYLHAGERLDSAPPNDSSSASHYSYDPAQPAPTLGGNTLMPGVYPPGPKDQRPLSQRADVLTFSLAPLARPLAAIGRVTARLWASSSAPDTDFVVRLLDIHPDGFMENIADGIIRARYRSTLAQPAWLEPEGIYPFNVDLWTTAHVFRVGHRVGVQVTSSSFPRWDRNWNTWDDPGTATTGQIAAQTIWHDAGHPSRIMLTELP
jgi:uncharacterized protein